jgi:hypothetical protein
MRRGKVKGKAELMLNYLIKHHAMKTYGEVNVQFHSLGTFVLDAGE